MLVDSLSKGLLHPYNKQNRKLQYNIREIDSWEVMWQWWKMTFIYQKTMTKCKEKQKAMNIHTCFYARYATCESSENGYEWNTETHVLSCNIWECQTYIWLTKVRVKRGKSTIKGE